MLPDGTNDKQFVEVESLEKFSIERQELINSVPGLMIATKIINN